MSDLRSLLSKEAIQSLNSTSFAMLILTSLALAPLAVASGDAQAIEQCRTLFSYSPVPETALAGETIHFEVSPDLSTYEYRLVTRQGYGDWEYSPWKSEPRWFVTLQQPGVYSFQIDIRQKLAGEPCSGKWLGSVKVVPPIDTLDQKFLPGRLRLDHNTNFFRVRDSKGIPLQFASPVAVARVSDSSAVICNYERLISLDLISGKAEYLDPPREVRFWYPTGLAYGMMTRRLYVANYKGSDVLLIDLAPGKGLTLVRRYDANVLKGPEAVAVSPDENLIAIADYDAGLIVLMNQDGKIMWKNELSGAHSVTFCGGETVCAAGLLPPTIVTYNLKGEVLRRQTGWGIGDKLLLYPTTVAFSEEDGLRVIDARSGQICKLKDDLEKTACLGGAGPDVNLLSFPYGFTYLEKGKLLVTDSGKDRLIVLNSETSEIERIYQLSDRTPWSRVPHTGTWSLGDSSKLTFDRDRYQAAYAKWWEFVRARLLGNSATIRTLEPVSDFLSFLPGMERVRKSRKFCHRFRVGTRSVHSNWWYPTEAGFSNEKGTMQLDCVSLSPAFWTNYAYFPFGFNVAQGERNYTIVASPLTPEILVISRGVAVSLPTLKNLWPVGQRLISDNIALNPGDAIQFAEEKIENFLAKVRGGSSNLSAMHEAIFPFVPAEQFAEFLLSSFVSAEGRSFLATMLETQDRQRGTVAAEQCIDQWLEQRCLHLGELLLMGMLLHDGTPAHFGPSGMCAPEAEK